MMRTLRPLAKTLADWLPDVAWRLARMISGAALIAGLLVAVESDEDFFITSDQRGQILMNEKEFQRAAETFDDPMRQGTAFYRAGDFEQAASAFAGLPGEEAAYNHGNSLVMLGKYVEAVAAYDRALEFRPDWQQAKTNREIARVRGERMEFEGGDMTGGKLGADEIVFDLNKNTPDAGDEVVEGGQEISDQELREMWLRQVQTTPSEFLKAKFAYQQAMGEGGGDE